MTREEIIADLTPDEAVAAIQRHLNAGVVGFHGLYAAHQMDYRASYHEVCLLSARWSNAPGGFDNPFARELRELLDRNGAFQPVGPGVFAVDTTYLGRSAFEDHHPQEAA